MSEPVQPALPLAPEPALQDAPGQSPEGGHARVIVEVKAPLPAASDSVIRGLALWEGAAGGGRSATFGWSATPPPFLMGFYVRSRPCRRRSP